MLKPLPLQFFDAGYCLHPELVVLRNGQIKPMRFPSMFAVIQHPTEGVILFDTGYSLRFLEITRRLPGRLYALMTPVVLRPEDCATAKLAKENIAPEDVRHIIVSHFHADHMCALGDFPKATYWFRGKAWRSVQNLGRWRGVYKGFLPELIPKDFHERSRVIETKQRIALPPEFSPFRQGYDLFGDGCLLAVDLPGHACGQIGLFLQSTSGRVFFLAADACWSSQSYREEIVPHPITKILFDNYRVYKETLADINALWRLRPEVLIAPSHCSEIHAQFCNKGDC